MIKQKAKLTGTIGSIWDEIAWLTNRAWENRQSVRELGFVDGQYYRGQFSARRMSISTLRDIASEADA